MRSLLFITLVFLITYSNGIAQLSDKFSVKLGLNAELAHQAAAEKYYTDTVTVPAYPFQHPTIFGHLKQAYAISLAVEYTLNPSAKIIYRPSLILRTMKSTLTDQDYYTGFSIKTLALGAGNNFLLVDGRKLDISFYINIIGGFSRLHADSRQKGFSFDDTINGPVSFSVTTTPIDKRFFITSFEPGITINYELTDRISLDLLWGGVFTHYPDFDAPSPSLYKQMTAGAGIRYVVLKRKKNY